VVLIAIAFVTLQVVNRVPSRTVLLGARVTLMLERCHVRDCLDKKPSQRTLLCMQRLESNLPRADSFVESRVSVNNILTRANLWCSDLACHAVSLALRHEACFVLDFLPSLALMRSRVLK
jgi:hypothetical protein